MAHAIVAIITAVAAVSVLSLPAKPGLCSRRADAQLFLTFDDGPDPAITLPLLDVLARHGALATFFITGFRAQRHPDVVRAVAERGHELAVHGERHLDYYLHPAAKIIVDLEEGRRSILAAVLNASISLFRTPYGAWNDNIAEAAKTSGLQSIMWTCSANDWMLEPSDASVDFIVKRVSPCLRRLPPAGSTHSRLAHRTGVHEPGVVLLAHDGLDAQGCCRSNGSVTPAFVDAILVEAARLQLKTGTCSPRHHLPTNNKDWADPLPPEEVV